MTGRGFCVKVELDVHAITCPGVWLCPNGKVALRVDSLDSYLESSRVEPVFPLLFHNKFIFQKIITGINTLIELQHCLEAESFYAELLQWSSRKSRPIVLATFRTNVAEILYPAPCFKGLLAGIDVDLLMDTTKAFPGIIAPKIEVSTKTTVEEMTGIFGNRNLSEIRTINPKIISSKSRCNHKSQSDKTNIRQRKVCHSQGITIPRHPRELTYHPSDYTTPTSTPLDCYHVIGTKVKLTPRDTASKDFAGNTCSNYSKECSVCKKYRHYFADELCSHGQQSSCSTRSPKSTNLMTRTKLRDYEDTSDESLIDNCFCTSQRQSEIHRIPSLTSASENRQEFYKNLEQFYKRMYKHAKMRAQESSDCT